MTVMKAFASISDAVGLRCIAVITLRFLLPHRFVLLLLLVHCATCGVAVAAAVWFHRRCNSFLLSHASVVPCVLYVLSYFICVSCHCLFLLFCSCNSHWYCHIVTVTVRSSRSSNVVVVAVVVAVAVAIVIVFAVVSFVILECWKSQGYEAEEERGPTFANQSRRVAGDDVAAVVVVVVVGVVVVVVVVGVLLLL